jgi:hypothetical protein
MDTNQETTLVTKEDLKGLTKRNIRDKEKKESVTRGDFADAIEAGYDYTDQQVGNVAEDVEQLRKQVDNLPSEGGGELPDLATVATTGQWRDLEGRPTIPEAYTNELAALAAKGPADAAATAAVDLLRNGVATPGDTLAKLYNLIVGAASQVNVATIAARDAYKVPKVPFNVFVTDDGDGRWALYGATSTGVNATFVKLSDPDLLNAAMSPAQIKAAYESNDNTNVLTDALLEQLTAVAQQGAATSGFSSLQALRASTLLKAGQTYRTAGYYAAKDLGGGTYYYDAASTETANGGTVLALTSTSPGRLFLLHTEYVQARQFGVRSDGKTDDTERLQAAINWVISCAGKLQLGFGTSKITDTLVLGLPETANTKPITDKGAFGEQNSFNIIGAGLIDNKNFGGATKGSQLRLYGTGKLAIMQLNPGCSFNAHLSDFSLVCDTKQGAEHGLLLNSTKFSQHKFRQIGSFDANRAYSILANGGENGEFLEFDACTGVGKTNFFYMGTGTPALEEAGHGLVGESYGHQFNQCLGAVEDGGYLVEVGNGAHGYNLTFVNCYLSGVVPGDRLRASFDTMKGTYLLRNKGASGTITFSGGRNENLSGLLYTSLAGLGGSARITFNNGLHFDGFGAGLNIPTIKTDGQDGNYFITAENVKFSGLIGKTTYFSNSTSLGDESQIRLVNCSIENMLPAFNAPFSKNGLLDIDVTFRRSDSKPQRYKKRLGYGRLAPSPNLLTPFGTAKVAAAPWVHYGPTTDFVINSPATQFGASCMQTCLGKLSGLYCDVPVTVGSDVLAYEYSTRVGGNSVGGQVRFSLENPITGQVYDQTVYTTYSDATGLQTDLKLVAMLQNVQSVRVRLEVLTNEYGWLFLQPQVLREATYLTLPPVG